MRRSILILAAVVIFSINLVRAACAQEKTDSTYSTHGLLEESSRAFKNNEIDKAISLLGRYIQLNPKYAEGYFRLGVIYANIKEFTKAAEYFSKTVEIDPSFAKAYLNLGSAYAELKLYNEALEAYTKALELEKDNPKIYYNVGLILAAGKNYTEASKFFLKARELCIEKNDAELLEKIDQLYKN